jgi:hypothetical protein
MIQPRQFILRLQVACFGLGVGGGNFGNLGFVALARGVFFRAAEKEPRRKPRQAQGRHAEQNQKYPHGLRFNRHTLAAGVLNR